MKPLTKPLREGVTICVCTFRRESLFTALSSVECLDGLADHGVSVVVVDNDETDILKSKIDELSTASNLPIKYIHAPAKNISIARNAALDAADTRWLLFIDDDEFADTEWLDQIMKKSSSADVVIGQCIATYAPTLPSWVSRCDFHSNRITGRLDNAYTSNALLNMEFVRAHGLRFRHELGKTGGEDTIFFREISGLGGTIRYCPEAIVFEPVPQGRATMGWVKTRMYRAGQTHGLVCKEFDPQSYRSLFYTAGAKAIFSYFMSAATIPGSDRSRKWLARAYLHSGAVHYCINPKLIEEYA